MTGKTISLRVFVLSALFSGCVDAFAAEAPLVKATRVFREARVMRGNTNLVRLQPIDEASWIWMKGDTAPISFMRFRNRFDGGGKVRIDVSADERFILLCDGKFVARGPNRADIENWQYQTYDLDLPDGDHVMEAVVWRTGDAGPLAQFTWKGGFVLKADGAFDRKLTTGKAKWEVAKLTSPRKAGKVGFGVGWQWTMTGTGFTDERPDKWQAAAVVRGPAGRDKVSVGMRTPGWMLFPSQIPDQTEYRTTPGRIRAVARDVRPGRHVFTAAEAEAAASFDISRPFTVPAKTRLVLAWDLGDYYCAYPEVALSGGKGARFELSWAECARDGRNRRKGASRGARDAIVGRFIEGFPDVFVSDGRENAFFVPPWFRCGKWCRVEITTGAEPLTVKSVRMLESRYPLEEESAFSSPQDASLAAIRRICTRSMQMCCHEMLYDCPYYEQQMYPGDTRVQLNILSSMTRDDRIIKRAIELFDLATHDDGMCPFNWPTRMKQEGASYTLCYLLMYGDYAMYHTDRAWLKARIPGMRKSMAGFECYEDADGLLRDLPGWNFMDWVPGWRRGFAYSSLVGQPPNCQINLFWVLAMRSAAVTERAMGNEEQAKYWEGKIERLKPAIVRRFWDDRRGILSDSEAMKCYSEHTQSLALLADVLPPDKAERAWKGLVSDPSLYRCTVYFSYYLFEAYFKYGRGDLFLKRLDLWRGYVATGLRTTQEAPGEARSDCHAWGAHPLWFMQTGLAGIRSDAPFFRRVRIAPSPGKLKEIKVRHPHPDGWIEAELTFDGGKASGTVKTPVGGVFEFGGVKVPLKPGVNGI